MKNRGLLMTLFLLLGALIGSNAQTTNQVNNQQGESISQDKIEVFYFHYERRCATCRSVENESFKALEELYPEKIKSGEITFLSINLEDETNESLIEDLKVSGQTLLIVKGDQQDNLTNLAFMHVNSNPDKLKKAIEKSVNKHL